MLHICMLTRLPGLSLRSVPHARLHHSRRVPCSALMPVAYSSVASSWLAQAAILAACTYGLLRVVSNALSRTPKLQWQRTPFNQAVLSRCPGLKSYYRVPALLANRHVETILAATLLRQAPVVTYSRCSVPCCCGPSSLLHLLSPLHAVHRKQLNLPDGGTVALDWENYEQDLQRQALLDEVRPTLHCC